MVACKPDPVNPLVNRGWTKINTRDSMGGKSVHFYESQKHPNHLIATYTEPEDGADQDPSKMLAWAHMHNNETVSKGDTAEDLDGHMCWSEP